MTHPTSRAAADFANIKVVCGSSRARAFGATGNPLAEDQFCAYEPHSEGH
jgi:MoaA/NifB/PqqE/SkfB family radical SAM enzyme